MSVRDPPRSALSLSVSSLAPWLLAAVAILLGLGMGTCTQDDAFISFRYAENLLDGLGLVFNAGERVEGYSNLSWTLLMAGAMGLGLDPVLASVLAGLCSLGALILISARLHRGSGAGLVALGLLALDSSLAAEAVEGLETVFYASILGAAGLFLVREVEARRAHVASSVFFGFAALTRPEAPLAFGAMHLGLLLHARFSGSPGATISQLRRSIQGCVPFVFLLVGLLAWRCSYYGEWLPNTYFAKTGGGFASVPRGLVYLLEHGRGHWLLWATALFGIVRRGHSAPAWAFLTFIVLHLCYVVWLGGDFKPTGRFLVPILPFLVFFSASCLDTVWSSGGRRARAMLLLLLGVGLLPYISIHQRSRAQALERHANLEARRTVGTWLSQTFSKDSWLAIHSAGVIPFYAGLPTIDMWGLSDAHIARVKNSAQGRGLAGHEKSDPAYVFAREPAIYLPEDRVFTLKPWSLEPDHGFPLDFTDKYLLVNAQIEGRWLNFWMRRDLAQEGAQNERLLFQDSPTALEQGR